MFPRGDQRKGVAGRRGISVFLDLVRRDDGCASRGFEWTAAWRALLGEGSGERRWREG